VPCRPRSLLEILTWPRRRRRPRAGPPHRPRRRRQSLRGPMPPASGFRLSRSPSIYFGPDGCRCSSMPSPSMAGPGMTAGGRRGFAAQLGAFLVMMLVVSWGGWLLWRGSRAGAGVAVATIPVEALFWYGFALPFRPCSRWSASCW
jgi:hypothetical protein